MGEGVIEGPITITVQPGTSEWGTTNSERWREDLHELYDELALAVPEAIPPAEPGEDDKGIGLMEIILALASSGAVTSTIDAFKRWLGKKPDRRELVATLQVGGETRTITVDATNVDSGDLVELVRALQAQPAAEAPAAGEPEKDG
jgi:hypothetical protein